MIGCDHWIKTWLIVWVAWKGRGVWKTFDVFDNPTRQLFLYYEISFVKCFRCRCLMFVRVFTVRKSGYINSKKENFIFKFRKFKTSFNSIRMGEKGHFHNPLCEEMIFPLLKGKKMDWGTKNDGLRYEVIIFFPEGIGNIISSHKRLGKCHSHYFNDQNIHLFP